MSSNENEKEDEEKEKEENYFGLTFNASDSRRRCVSQRKHCLSALHTHTQTNANNDSYDRRWWWMTTELLTMTATHLFHITQIKKHCCESIGASQCRIETIHHQNIWFANQYTTNVFYLNLGSAAASNQSWWGIYAFLLWFKPTELKIIANNNKNFQKKKHTCFGLYLSNCKPSAISTNKSKSQSNDHWHSTTQLE